MDGNGIRVVEDDRDYYGDSDCHDEEYDPRKFHGDFN